MSEHDPQVPPQDTPAPEAPPGPPKPPGWTPEGPSGPRASFGRRFVAYLIDGILIAIVYGISLAIFPTAIAYGLNLLVGLAYFSSLEGGPRGQTLGKMALGIRVIDFNTGGPIGYGRGGRAVPRQDPLRARLCARLPLDAVGQGEAVLAGQDRLLGGRAGAVLPGPVSTPRRAFAAAQPVL